MKIRIHKDLVSGVFFLLAAVLLLIVIPGQVKVVTHERVNSRTFPYLIALIMMSMSITTIVSAIRNIVRKKDTGYLILDLHIEFRALQFIILLVLYPVLMPLIGYLASSLIMVVVFLALFGTRNWKYYAIVIITTCAVYAAFKLALNIQLPSIGG